jgi:hypothetical protein
MKVHQYREMMRYLTRPAPDPSFKQLATRMPLKPGGLVEPGVTHYGKVEGSELIESLKKKKDVLGRPYISSYQEKLKILEDLQKNKYINPKTNKAFTPKEWLDASATIRSKARNPQAFLDKKSEYQRDYVRKRKLVDPAFKERQLTSRKELYYKQTRKKIIPSGIQSGRGVLTEQRNKMLTYMSNAARKGNTNYTEIIKDGKFLGVRDNAAGINYYEAGYKGKLGSKSKLITAHPDFKNVNSLAKMAEKFKRALPNKAIQSYFSAYGRVPKMGELYNYLQADPRYLSRMDPRALTNNPLQLHHQISMTESPTRKFQLLLKDRNNQAGVLMEEFKKGNITKDKLNTELKKINARVKAEGRYIGAKDIVPEQQVKVAKKQTTQLFNKMLKENPKQLETIAKILNKSFRCGQADGISCDDPRAYMKALEETKIKAAKGNVAALNKFKKVANAMNKLKGAAALTGWGILGEIGFALPFAAMDYESGLTAKRILGNATFNLLGQSEQEELLTYLPKGSKGAEQMAATEAHKRLTKLEEGPQPRGRIGMDRTKFQTAQQKVMEGANIDFINKMTPFMQGPRNEYFNEKAFIQAYGEVDAAKAKQVSENLKREEERKAGQEQMLSDYYQQGLFNTGGRVGFKLGGIDKGRRAFMKWLAGITGAGVVGSTGLLKFGKTIGTGKTAIKAGDTIIQGTSGMPDWFIPLVNRIVKEGDDVTKKLGTVEREIVHTKKIGQGEEVTVYQNLDTGNVRVEYGPHLLDKKGNIIRASNDSEVVHLEYRAPQIIDEGKHAGKKTDPEFSAAESEPEVVNWDGDIEFSGINEVNKVDDLVTDTSKLKGFGQKKLTNRDKVIAKKKQKYQKKLQEDQGEQLDYIEKKYPSRSMSDYVKEEVERYDNYLPGIDDIE